MPLNIGEYLFPRDLAISSSHLNRVLFVGSCIAMQMAYRYKSYFPEVCIDTVMFNNVSDLPQLTEAEASSYQFQYISLPLREILTDKIVNFSNFISEEGSEAAYAEAFARLEQLFSAATRHNREHGMLTFVANFLEPQAPVASSLSDYHSPSDLVTLIRLLNQWLVAMISEAENTYLADIESIAKSIGKSAFQDDMIMFYSHAGNFDATFVHYDLMPEHNPAGPRIEPIPELSDIFTLKDEEYYRAVWRQAETLYRIVRQIDMVKLVVFDLDDTLWRGQLAEHYGDDGVWPSHIGWPLGIWEAIQHLRSRGIMVGICSKNDEGLVRARWDRGLSLRWISLDDFTFVEIGWRPKAEAIASMIAQAGLTPKSVVFVDDNPVEREAVKSAMPEIRTLGSNPYTIRRTLLWSSETQVPILTKESATRNAMVQGQQARERSRTALSREEFLSDLRCQVRITEVATASGAAFARSMELLNKTNQFNTTGERFNHQQIVQFFREGGKFYVFEVEDRFTEYGLVGVIRFKDQRFLQFAMSCRVLGLEIETSVVRHLMSKEGCAEFFADVRHTDTNMVCRDVYIKCGFVALASGDFRWDASGDVAPPASHLTISDSFDPENAMVV